MAEQSNITPNRKVIYKGMNLNNIPMEKGDGVVSYALNAIMEGFNDDGEVVYQNEQANEECSTYPERFQVIGTKNLIEEQIIILFLTDPLTGECEIGKIVNCQYSAVINAKCLLFDINHPIMDIVHRKTNCGLEIYWVDGINKMRWIDLNNLPYAEHVEGCLPTPTGEIDCNKMSVQPQFSIPQVDVTAVKSDGQLTAGDYQFAVQYANALSEAYTSFYSITNPLPVFDPNKITANFDEVVGQSINVEISNIDTTGLYDYINVAVIKTVNNVSTPELVGTFLITKPTLRVTYTGQSDTDIKLSIDDIFQKFEIYETANNLTTAQDVLIAADLTSTSRLSYQDIANNVTLKWQSWRLNGNKPYANGLNCINFTGYMRDEIVPFELVFLLKNGKQTDRFTIPSRKSVDTDLTLVQNNDTDNIPVPRWSVYNTASVTDFSSGYNHSPTYEGAYQFGEFAYWESTELYPCNPIYGDIKNLPIRHHKFPDELVSPHFDSDGYIYPIGVTIDVDQVISLIKNSLVLTEEQKQEIQGFKIVRGNMDDNKSIVARGILRNVGKYNRDEQTFYFPNYPYNDLRSDPFLSITQTGNDSGSNGGLKLEGFATDESKNRFTFNSPDTSFKTNPLGNHLKIESLLYGNSKGHFVPVQKHSQYKFLSLGAYLTSIGVAVGIGFLSSWKLVGLVDGGNLFDGAAAFAAYQTFVDILYQACPKINYTYQMNSIADYSNQSPVTNTGNKVRSLDIAAYLIPGMISVGDEHTINNFQRESSVYLRLTRTLPFPSITDTTRFINSESNCNTTIKENPTSLYYGTIKNTFENQWGQLYSYSSVDTGYQKLIDLNTQYGEDTFFGGDTFINKFAFKTKIPFFLDNRVGFPDESDIDYRDFGNVAYPTYWFSSDVDTAGFHIPLVGDINLIPRKINNFDCDSHPIFFQKGKVFLFAYGIPYFYCESRINTDLRQAYNSSEGDFFPHVSSDIPDFWLQETNTSIQFDNTYTYNITYSKDNDENFFSNLPEDYTTDTCRSVFPWRLIFSENKTDSPNPSLRNNWLIYKPASKVDLPQNYGRLIGVNGIENRQVLVRFESKALLYNVLLTAPTSVAGVYLGQSLFSSQVPPIDYADTDSGYIGTQHKFLLKTEHGHIVADSKRGQIFVLNGTKSTELTDAATSKFFTTFLDFSLQKVFPTYNIDNNFNGVGLHGIYDPKYNRLVLTKLDYEPLNSQIQWNSVDNTFSINDTAIELSDTNYFCNRSFTVSYDFDNQCWISFHSYLPNYYIPEASFFYSGIKESNHIWKHDISMTRFNNFYGVLSPYTIEYPYAFTNNDEIIQNIKDYSRVLTFSDYYEFIETDDAYFNELTIFNGQECSGTLLLTAKPKSSLADYNKFPIYNTDSKEVIYTKSGSFYQVNTFWNMVRDVKKLIWKRDCTNLSLQKTLNQDNMDYSKRSYRKGPIRGKWLKVRFTLNNRDDIKILSNFTITPTMQSYK